MHPRELHTENDGMQIPYRHTEEEVVKSRREAQVTYDLNRDELLGSGETKRRST